MTDAQNNGSAGLSEVTLTLRFAGRVLEDGQSYGRQTRCVTNSAFTSYPASEFTFPTPDTGSARKISNTYDLLYRRMSVHDEAGGYDIASWNFFGPSRVAQVLLGNGLICTWMNNAVTNSAVQLGVPNPGWTSGDFLGYDGAGRMIAKRFLSLHTASALGAWASVPSTTAPATSSSSGPCTPRTAAISTSYSTQRESAPRWLRFARPPAPVSARHALEYRRIAMAMAAGRSSVGGSDHCCPARTSKEPISWTAWATGGRRPSRL